MIAQDVTLRQYATHSRGRVPVQEHAFRIPRLS